MDLPFPVRLSHPFRLLTARFHSANVRQTLLSECSCAVWLSLVPDQHWFALLPLAFLCVDYSSFLAASPLFLNGSSFSLVALLCVSSQELHPFLDIILLTIVNSTWSGSPESLSGLFIFSVGTRALCHLQAAHHTCRGWKQWELVALGHILGQNKKENWDHPWGFWRFCSSCSVYMSVCGVCACTNAVVHKGIYSKETFVICSGTRDVFAGKEKHVLKQHGR